MRNFHEQFTSRASVFLLIVAPLYASAQSTQPPPPFASATTLTSNSPTLTLPGSLTLTSTVAAPKGGGLPTGKVNFTYDSNNALGNAILAPLSNTQKFSGLSNTLSFGTEPFPFWATSLFSATEMDLATSDLSQFGPKQGPVLTIFPGLGRGGFNTSAPQTLETLPTGTFIDAIASGDFKNDGNQEFLLHLRQSSETSGGALGEYDVVNATLADTSIAVPACPEDGSDPNCNFGDPDNETLVVDDFTGDGFADVASLVSNYPSSLQNYVGNSPVSKARIRIAVNNGITATVGFTFGSNATLPTFTDPNGQAPDLYCPVSIASGQFRKGGNKDVISVGLQSISISNGDGGYITTLCAQPASSSPGYLVLLLGDGKGGLTYQTPVPLSSRPSAVGVGDFNQDGKLDAVVAMANTLEILYGNGDGTFSSNTFTINAGNVPGTLRVADFNGDGYPDVAISDTSDSNVYVLLNDGTGKLQAPVLVYTATEPPISILTQDMNGDGLPDLTALVPPAPIGGGIIGLRSPSVPARPELLAAAAADPGTIAVFLDSASAQAVLTTAAQSLPAGSHTLTASFPGDINFDTSTSANVPVTVGQTAPVITWLPPASIVYGTALSATQLNATANLPGTLAYTPAAGTILKAGTSTLSVLFAPSDSFDYSAATASVSITVTKGASIITWPPPAAIEYGTPLGAAQLNATANVPGTFVYTPAAGAILQPGSTTLSVVFNPTDAVDYSTATASVPIAVTPASLSSISPASANLGGAGFSLSVVGQGFTQGATVQWNGSALVTSYVDLNHLTAQVPASLLTTGGTATVTVMDPASVPVSGSATFTIISPTAVASATGPQTSDPATQPSIQVTLNPYPADVTVSLTLSFAPAPPNQVSDPTILFANGTTIDTFVVPANSTAAIAPISLQSGTTAGTITINVQLTAGGSNITPSTLAPIVITVPAEVPAISSVTLTRNGQTLQLVIDGLSSPRDMSQADFHFTAAPGATLKTTDLTVSLTGAFTTWYQNQASTAFGTAFEYTQPFTLDSAATDVQSVTVTLTNSVGKSQPASAQ
ncbi:MAG: FG-GAP-like repeat-containing protein [Silvibacterium sp.]